jgi:sugar phosphate isomerase/epimerase
MPHACTRRDFLHGAAAAGAAFLAGRHCWAGNALQDPYGGFPMGIQSYSLRAFDTDRVLKEVQGLGLHYIEYIDSHYPHASTADQIATMNKKMADHGIKPVAHGVHAMTKDHEANRAWFEFAKKAGIKTITADPEEESFDSLDKLVDEYDIRIAIHNHGPGARYDKIADVLNAIRGHDKRIGACADLGHYIRSAEDPVRAINLFEGRLYGVHLKDFAEPKGDAKGVILGRGQLDVPAVFKALKKVGFPTDGALSIEYEENFQNPVADIQECVAVAADAARKVGAA